MTRLRRAVYIGPRRSLKGATAMLRPDNRYPDAVQARFDSLVMAGMFTTVWPRFWRTEFRLTEEED